VQIVKKVKSNQNIYFSLQCTPNHISNLTKAKLPGTPARNVAKKNVSRFTSMATHTNPYTPLLVSAIVLSNVDITIHLNNTFLIIPLFLLPFGEAGWGLFFPSPRGEGSGVRFLSPLLKALQVTKATSFVSFANS